MMATAIRKPFVLALTAVMVTALASPAGAQDAPPPEPAAASQAPTVSDAITVTAQKREESIQDVPVSITALDAETIELLTAGGADVQFLSSRVPSLQLESSFGKVFPRFYIRGLGNTDFDFNASQPVSMVVDEVVLENPMVKAMPIFDIERIEVLRGPQGTLFGRNTPAGVVKFETKKPSREYDASLRASFATFEGIDLKTAFGGALTEHLSARLSLLFQSQEDWVDNTFTGENNSLGGYDSAAFRLQFLYQPNDRLSALLNVHAWDLDGTARIFRANIFKPGTNDLRDGFEQDKVAFDGLNEQRVSASGGVFKLDYDLGNDLTLTSVSGYETLTIYSRGDVDGGFGCGFCAEETGPGFIPFDAQSADGISGLEQTTQEIRVASDTGGRWDWLAGYYYFNEDLAIDSFNYLSGVPGDPQLGYAFQNQDATSWALFGSLDYRPSDLWSFKAGLRYTTEDKDFSAERPEAWFTNGPTVAPIKVKTSADLVTWDFSATRKVSDLTNVYGRIGTGFRAPSIQGRILFCNDPNGGADPATNCVSVAQEEEILSAEVGVKTELLERRLRLNLTAYKYQLDGQQIVAVGGQYNTATLLNADKTDGYGLEADIQIAPSSAWLFTLGAGYNHTAIDDPNLGVAPCFACTVTDPIVDGLARIDGNSLPHSPELTFNGVIDYRKPTAEGLVSASVDWAWASDKHFFLYESKEFKADSFELGARVGYTFAEARYELALFARNLTDEINVQGGIDFNNLTGMTNEPRRIGLEFVTRFGK